MDTADEKIARRAAVESQHNKLRDDREAQFTADKRELEEQFHRDMATLRNDKEAALTAVGLNPDGGDPQGRQQGQAA